MALRPLRVPADLPQPIRRRQSRLNRAHTHPESLEGRSSERMMQAEKTCLLIADISGYTEYLAGVEIDHAQDILADLITTVVTALGPHFRLEKLEGDAAFCSAPAETVDGSVVLDTIERCYFGFRR